MHQQPRVSNELQGGGDSRQIGAGKGAAKTRSDQHVNRAEHPRSVHNSGVIEVDGLPQECFLDNDTPLGYRLSRRIQADRNWFENLVTHAPTVGTFYESLLRDILAELKPTRLSVSTGFVYDTERRAHSRQLDILVYDDTEEAALYRNREFVVVTPEILVSAAEVKKTLKLEDVRNVTRSTINARLGTHKGSPRNVQFINVFAYSSPHRTKTIATCLTDEITQHVAAFQARTVSGHQAMVAAMSIVLPRIYFLDRPEFIEGHLAPSSGGWGKITVEVSEPVDPGLEDGLNHFVSAMLPSSRDLDLQPNLRSIPLEHPKYSLDVGSPIVLLSKISVRELALRFPKERDTLTTVRIRDERPYAAMTSSFLDWSKISGLSELQKTRGFLWLTIPDTPSPTKPTDV